MAGALTAFVISIAPNPFAANEIINWLMGALTDRLMADVWTALPFMAMGVALLLSTGRALDALTLGENGAKSLGINLFRLQWVIVLGVGLAVGASVAVAAAEGDVADAVVILARPVGGCWVATLSSAADLCGTEQVCSGCGRAQAARARLRCTTLVGVLEARRQDEAAVSITTTERSAASARALGEVGGGKGRSSAAPN